MSRLLLIFTLALLGCSARVFAQTDSAPAQAPIVKPVSPPPPGPVPPGPKAVASQAPSPLPPILKPSSPPPPALAISGKVWGALVYATDGKPAVMPDSVPPELSDLPKRLGKVFHYTRFEMLGARTQDIFRQYESWVVPSKELFMKLDSKGPAPGGGLRLDLQFWRLDKVLVKTDAVLRPRSPLFILGPKWRDGRLVFVLLLTK